MKNNNNLYELLKLDKTATTEEIKKSYKKLAMEYHPDKTKNDKDKCEIFKDVSHAYSVLGNEKSRKEYDIFGIVDENNVNYSDISNIFEQIFKTNKNKTSSYSYASFINIEDIFNEINNLDCEVNIVHNMPSVSKFENMFSVNKDKFKVNFDKFKPKTSTKSSFSQENLPKTQETHDRETDKISGVIILDDVIDGNPKKIFHYNIYDKCSSCNGLSTNIICECHGEKLINVSKSVEINIKPGIEQNAKFTFAEYGSYNLTSQTYNNLQVTIKYDLPKNIKIKNTHLIVYLQLTLKEIFCGFSKKIKLGQKYIDVDIDDYINPNEPIIYENCGIYINETKKGNIIIMPKIVYPNDDKVIKYNESIKKLFDSLY